MPFPYQFPFMLDGYNPTYTSGTIQTGSNFIVQHNEASTLQEKYDPIPAIMFLQGSIRYEKDSQGNLIARNKGPNDSI